MNFASLLQGMVALLWLVVIGLVVLLVSRASRGGRTGALTTTLIVSAVLAVVLSGVSAGLVFIEPEERGVVISALQPKGYREMPLQPGLRWIIPGFERTVIYKISRDTYTMSIAPSEGAVAGDDSISTRTADGQEVLIDASVIFAINPDQVIQLHIEWQERYVDGVIRPLSRGIIRGAVSQFGIEEVYGTKRAELARLIEEELRVKLEENGLILGDFVLRNITFSPEYAASVEQKQIAEQQAQQAKFVVEQRRQEAEQARQVAQGQADASVIRATGEGEARVIQAEAEAQALERLAVALLGKEDLLQYQYITKLAPGVQVMLVPSNAPYLLPLPSLEPTAPTTAP